MIIDLPIGQSTINVVVVTMNKINLEGKIASESKGQPEICYISSMKIRDFAFFRQGKIPTGFIGPQRRSYSIYCYPKVKSLQVSFSAA